MLFSMRFFNSASNSKVSASFGVGREPVFVGYLLTALNGFWLGLLIVVGHNGWTEGYWLSTWLGMKL